MRKLQFEQGSQEWLEWRKGLITATDAPVIMGVSPYATPLQLWKRKLGLIPEQEVNSAMLRGKHDEPIARQMFIDETKINMNDVCIESSEYSFIGASLDGISDCDSMFLEIKSNKREYHEMARRQIVPEFHLMQMYHQALASDGKLKKGFYGSYNSGELLIVEIEPDEKVMKKYLHKAIDFRKKILLQEEPERTDKDYRDRSDNIALVDAMNQYRELDQHAKAIEDQKKYYKDLAVAMCEDESSCGPGFKIIKKHVKGRVDYASIPDVQIMDVEKYRKPTTQCWSILVD